MSTNANVSGPALKFSRASIARWMRAHAAEHLDCGEVNLTSLVEAWDSECADGAQTLDPDHLAWDVAVEVAA
jgi:hypothetical protein